MVSGGPGEFRKVREAGKNNFLLFSPESDLMVPSYDQKQFKNFFSGVFTYVYP